MKLLTILICFGISHCIFAETHYGFPNGAPIPEEFEDFENPIKLKKYINLDDIREVQLHRLFGSSKEPLNLLGYNAVSFAKVTDPASIIEITSEIQYELNYKMRGLVSCFDPHHAITLVTRKNTLDVLICYDCNFVALYLNSEEILRSPIVAKSERMIDFLFDKHGATPYRNSKKK